MRPVAVVGAGSKSLLKLGKERPLSQSLENLAAERAWSVAQKIASIFAFLFCSDSTCRTSIFLSRPHH